ncbi:Uncharacterised protein [Mycobacteroides abscessus subsp. abscessus]|nr:Uncharacterised protein [Mycobacteroides abscessus subsp. abscessus]
MSRLRGFRGEGLVVVFPCRVGVECEVELVCPAKLEARLAQSVVAFLSSRVGFGEIG